jgi:hypothetical protein
MIPSSRPICAKVRKTLFQNQNTNERAGGVDQVVEHLHTMLIALRSIPSTTKNSKTKYEKDQSLK